MVVIVAIVEFSYKYLYNFEKKWIIYNWNRFGRIIIFIQTKKTNPYINTQMRKLIYTSIAKIKKCNSQQ